MNIFKLSYLTAGIAFLCVACASETPDPGITMRDNRIYFRTGFLEEETRAQSVTKDDLDEFYVTVFNPAKAGEGILEPYIDNEAVRRSDDNPDIFSSENCMWPDRGYENHDLTFFAYYPHLNDGEKPYNASTVSGSETNLDFRIKDFHISTDISEQVDFIAAYKIASMKSDMYKEINLDFEHRLSRIEVNAKGANNNCKIEIAGILIGDSPTLGTYQFKPEEGAGEWISCSNKNDVKYIYSAGDKIVTLDNTETPVSIMGGTEGINYAMLLPGKYVGWDVENDNLNSGEGMYFGVLLRVIDKKGTQQYPYTDTYQGANALNIPKVYLAVSKDGTVADTPGKLYKGTNGKYYTDPGMTIAYTAPQGSEVREFGWATLPVSADWEAGYYYTYTLDYTYGVGLHSPDVEPSPGPNAGDPIISDKVGLTVSVKPWQTGTAIGITVP